MCLGSSRWIHYGWHRVLLARGKWSRYRRGEDRITSVLHRGLQAHLEERGFLHRLKFFSFLCVLQLGPWVRSVQKYCLMYSRGGRYDQEYYITARAVLLWQRCCSFDYYICNACWQMKGMKVIYLNLEGHRAKDTIIRDSRYKQKQSWYYEFFFEQSSHIWRPVPARSLQFNQQMITNWNAAVQMLLHAAYI